MRPSVGVPDPSPRGAARRGRGRRAEMRAPSLRRSIPAPECGCVRVCVRVPTVLQPVVNPSCLGIKTLPCNLRLRFPLDAPSLQSPRHF